MYWRVIYRRGCARKLAERTESGFPRTHEAISSIWMVINSVNSNPLLWFVAKCFVRCCQCHCVYLKAFPFAPRARTHALPGTPFQCVWVCGVRRSAAVGADARTHAYDASVFVRLDMSYTVAQVSDGDSNNNNHNNVLGSCAFASACFLCILHKPCCWGTEHGCYRCLATGAAGHLDGNHTHRLFMIYGDKLRWVHTNWRSILI